jgi:hypothetical protein
MVDAEWREVIVEGGGRGYLEVDGKRRAVEVVNGKWRIQPTGEAND